MNQLNGYKGRHKLKCYRRFSPSQKKSLGYEYKDKNGHWKIKIKEPDVYIQKSRYVYEKYKGKYKQQGYEPCYAVGSRKRSLCCFLICRSVTGNIIDQFPKLR